MGQEQLSDLSVLSIDKKELEKLKASSMNDIINTFGEKRARKVPRIFFLELSFLIGIVVFYTLTLMRHNNFETLHLICFFLLIE